MRVPGIYRHGKANQLGAALMIMIAILVVGFAAILVGTLSFSAMNNARQQRTSDALAKAKSALLGAAASDFDPTNIMPGSLPCPDTNDDGDAELIASGVCPTYIGRLPWRTLKLPDLRDGSGERLWYALSLAFRNDITARPINSNTKGTLLVYNADGLSLQTKPGYSAVAVIFAPGSPVGYQVRSTAAQQNSAANYLDIANSRDNAVDVGPFIAGTKSDTFNDRLLFITTQDLMPLVEQRVAGEVRRTLDKYFTDNGYYPWADTIGPSPNYNSDNGQNRGFLPDVTSTAGTANWAAGYPAQWFIDNQWYTLVYYAVGRNYTPNPIGCSSCQAGVTTLSVNGVGGVQVLFFMPGTYNGTRAIDILNQYLEDAQNNDNANDTYVTPTSQAFDRDRLYMFSGTKWKP